MLVPIRHIRPHIADGAILFTQLLFTGDLGEALQRLMSCVESCTPFATVTLGRVWSVDRHSYVCVPEDVFTNPPAVFVAGLALSKLLSMGRFDGLQYGA